jgi:hypothetical protein
MWIASNSVSQLKMAKSRNSSAAARPDIDRQAISEAEHHFGAAVELRLDVLEVLIAEQDVIRLDITVNDPEAVDEVKHLQELPHDPPDPRKQLQRRNCLADSIK